MDNFEYDESLDYVIDDAVETPYIPEDDGINYPDDDDFPPYGYYDYYDED